jgi:murein DD-endopeptidase MepM/ murein hydrolase activator NlpD
MARRARTGYQGYVYPFSKTATVGRIDQGQDFGGRSSILAIGNAQVVKLGAPGWPGGENGILYRLLDGPRRGRYVYVYEGVRPSVRVGQRVGAGEVIGHIIPGSSTGIETGWSKANGEPVSHAEYHEGLETRGGKSFAHFLSKLPRPHVGITPADERRAQELAKEEGGKIGIGGVYGVGGLKQAEEVAEGEKSPGNIANEVISTPLGDIHPAALMLNIGLIGGGAFLVYYGAALMLGVKRPVAGPAEKAAGAAAAMPK